MATPPPDYTTIVSQGWTVVEDSKSRPDAVQRWNIQEVVSASRTQNVGSVVKQLLPQIQAQAEHGHSRSEFILIPSNEDNARDGNLVGLDAEKPPLIIQFEGKQNSTAFWSQKEVLLELKKQLDSSLGVPEHVETPKIVLPTVQQKPSRSSSWFGRSAPKEQPVVPVVEAPKQQPVVIQVSWDDLHARIENEYGLYETKRAGAVFITILHNQRVNSW